MSEEAVGFLSDEDEEEDWQDAKSQDEEEELWDITKFKVIEHLSSGTMLCGCLIDMIRLTRQNKKMA